MTKQAPLRIAFRVGIFPKLSETFVLNQINLMSEAGHDVTVLADTGPKTLEASLAAETEAARARTTYIQPRNDNLLNLYEKMPYRVRRGREAAAERKICEDNDAVVCNFGWFGAKLVEATRGRKRRAKIVTIYHGDDMSRHLSGGNGHAYDQLMQDGDAHLSANSVWHERLKGMGAPDARNAIHYLGVDPDRFEFTSRMRAANAPFELMTVCRLVEKKGLIYALQALAKVKSERPDLPFRFRIYGDGPLKVFLETQAIGLGLGNEVKFLGRVPNTKVAEALKRAEAFVHPSIVADDGDMEGLPISMMEAMATGLPIVSTYHSGIPELVIHGENGLLSTERDVDHLSDQFIRMMSDTEGRDAMAKAARHAIESKFNVHVSVQRLECFIRQSIADVPLTGDVKPHFADV